MGAISKGEGVVYRPYTLPFCLLIPPLLPPPPSFRYLYPHFPIVEHYRHSYFQTLVIEIYLNRIILKFRRLHASYSILFYSQVNLVFSPFKKTSTYVIILSC